MQGKFLGAGAARRGCREAGERHRHPWLGGSALLVGSRRGVGRCVTRAYLY